MVRVIPARDGLKVRCPETRQYLPPEGREVDLSPTGTYAAFWTRLIADGDVVIVDANATESA